MKNLYSVVELSKKLEYQSRLSDITEISMNITLYILDPVVKNDIKNPLWVYCRQ